MNSHVTMKDIASALNISVDAVSKALKDSSEISQLTKEKVRAKADELGYVKNSVAVSLKTGSSNSVAIYVNSIINPYFTIMVDTLVRNLTKNGYIPLLTLINSYTLRLEDLTNLYINKCNKAILLVSPEEDAYKALKDNGVEIYLVGIKDDHKDISYAITDDFDGGYQVGEYFAKSNYKKALYFTGSPSETSKRRCEGFVEGIKKNCNKEYGIVPLTNYEKLYDIVISRIKNENFDFAFAHNDFIASVLQDELAKIGLADKIKIVGFDGVGQYIRTFKTIDTVSGNYEEIATYVVDHIKRNEKFKKVFKVKMFLS